MTNVLIVEDEPLARQMFELFVKQSDRYRLVSSIDSAEYADMYCDNAGVDLVLMDVLTAGHANGLDAADRIKRRHPGIKIIIVTSMPEYSYIRRAKEIGVDCFWYKEAASEPFYMLMDRCMAGERIFPDTTPELIIGNAKSGEFTPKECEVLKELLSGDSDKVIADRLGVSVDTVRWHIKNMLQKTGFKSRLALAIRARESGFVIKD